MKSGYIIKQQIYITPFWAYFKSTLFLYELIVCIFVVNILEFFEDRKEKLN